MWVTSGLFCGSVDQMGHQVRPTFNPGQVVQSSEWIATPYINMGLARMYYNLCGYICLF